MSERPRLAKAPYRLRDELSRQVVAGVSCPLGVHPCEPAAVLVEGYEWRFLPGSEDFDDQCEYRVVLSTDRVKAVFEAFLDELLADEVYALYEEASYDAFRESDAYRSRETVPRERFRQAWDTYGRFFIEDGKCGFGVLAYDPSIEVFIEEHGVIYVACGLELRARVEDVLERQGVPERQELRSIENFEHQHRDILDVESGAGGMDELDIKFSIIESLSMDIVNPDENSPPGPCPFWAYVELDLSFVRKIGFDLGCMSFGLTAKSHDQAVSIVEDAVLEQLPDALVVRFVQLYRMVPEDITDEIAPADRTAIAQLGTWYVSDPEFWR